MHILSPVAGPVLYVAEVDYAAEHQAAFEAWYANRHAPDLLRFGSRTVSSYRPKVGGLAVFNVYQIDDSEVFKTERYKSINARDPYGAGVRATSTGQKRYQTLYLERATAPGPKDEPVATVDADWISVARFDLPETEDAAAAGWTRGAALEMLSPLGLRRLRYGTRMTEQVGAGSDRPRCILFAEWPVEPPVSADLVTALQKRFGAKVSGAMTFVGWRRYPWPDKR